MEGKVLVSFKASRSEVDIGGVTLGKDPVFIAGPCSIESREHIMEEARELKKIGVDILRGGAYKPRTSPKSFQGLGYEGIKYIYEAGQEYGLPIVTEVLKESAIDKMYPYVDAFQVGARNMYNYELLKLLGQTDKPIILKRGLSATLDEWVGAAKYIVNEGNDRVVLCERGIRSYDPSTRNLLDLAGATLVKLKTGLPVIADPSHGTGRRDLVGPMVKASLAAGLDGVMVEVHRNPNQAKTDGFQSLDYHQYKEIRSQYR